MHMKLDQWTALARCVSAVNYTHMTPYIMYVMNKDLKISKLFCYFYDSHGKIRQTTYSVNSNTNFLQVKFQVFFFMCCQIN